MRDYLQFGNFSGLQDSRPLDDWGEPIGPSYVDKSWDKLTYEEMIRDFEWKNGILASEGEEISSYTFYQDYLFKDLYTSEVGDFISEDDKVCPYKIILLEYGEEEGTGTIRQISRDEIPNFFE